MYGAEGVSVHEITLESLARRVAALERRAAQTHGRLTVRRLGGVWWGFLRAANSPSGCSPKPERSEKPNDKRRLAGVP